jgi:GntR family transcriptional regulator
VTVSKDDPRPSWLQVRDNIAEKIKANEYQPGQRIPSNRALAKQYGVALNTVQHAIESLKAGGILVSHPPRGVFVGTGSPPEQPPAANPAELMTRLDEILDRLDQLEDRVDAVEKTRTTRRPGRQRDA